MPTGISPMGRSFSSKAVAGIGTVKSVSVNTFIQLNFRYEHSTIGSGVASALVGQSCDSKLRRNSNPCLRNRS
jgi:hypothetical protein